MSSPLPRGAVLGMLGGGQLGRMTALDAARLGYRVHVFCPGPGPASQVSDDATFAAYDDREALAAFAAKVDAITYEFENVPAETATFLAGLKPVRPGPHVLATAQDRILEKTFLTDVAGAPVAPWAEVRSLADLTEALERIGRPAVLKTARGGYDGKGQVLIRPETDAQQAWNTLAGDRSSLPTVLEGFVPFDLEVSVVVARDVHGQTATWDCVENEHEHHILRRTHAPARISPAVREKAEHIAHGICATLDVVGVLGVEFFVVGEDVLVNEMAPRPHNSGHWTQDGAMTSQFEQHARAVMGLPLGSTRRLFNTVMHNLLGDEIDDLEDAIGASDHRIHLYGKGAPRPGRKMGHINVISPITE